MPEILTPDSRRRHRCGVSRGWGCTSAYGSRRLVAGLEFSVRAGEIFGLIGPHAPAKPARFTSSLGVIEPSEWQGARLLAGRPNEVAVERHWLPDPAVLQYPDLSVEENLRYVAWPAAWCPRALAGSGAGSLLRRLGLGALSPIVWARQLSVA